MSNKPQKILIIRFSSFGDIVFTMSTLPSLKAWAGKEGTIDWLVRSDMEGILKGQNITHKTWSFSRKDGFFGLIKKSLKLREEKYDLVYDAHCNVRSFVARFFICFLSSTNLIKRKKQRLKRILLFKFRKVTYKNWPYKAMVSFLDPLKKNLSGEWKLSTIEWVKTQNDIETKGKIILVPSAAWEMKRWPVSHWQELVTLMDKEKFIILGGPEDHFCEEIKKIAPNRVENFAGKLSLAESCSVISEADFVVTGDTGLAQVADLTGVKGLTLIGPTAFGFPSMGKMKPIYKNLECMPCSKDGRGNCNRDIYQECMVSITPQDIALEIRSATV